MLDTMRGLRLLDLGGDILEIGVFLGGGTYTLASFAAREKPGVRVIAVDVFNTDFDETKCVDGHTMAQVYSEMMHKGGTTEQRTTFDQITAGLENVEVVAGDSTTVTIPTDHLSFSFIDGNHEPAYVEKDFDNAWSRTLPGGVVALHDYGHNLPQVTKAVQRRIGVYADEIERLWIVETTIYLRKARLAGP